MPKDRKDTKKPEARNVKIADTEFVSSTKKDKTREKTERTDKPKKDKTRDKTDKTDKPKKDKTREKTGKSGAHRDKPKTEEKDLLFVLEGKPLLCNGEPPTEAELKKFAISEPKPPKPLVYMVLSSGSEVRCYSKVPRDLLSPYLDYLNGNIDQIHDNRIALFKKANPMATQRQIIKLVKWPGEIPDISKFEDSVAKYYIGHPRGFIVPDETQQLFFGSLMY